MWEDPWSFMRASPNISFQPSPEQRQAQGNSQWQWQPGKFSDDMFLGMASLLEKAGIAKEGRARSEYDQILGKAALPPSPNKSLALPDEFNWSPGKFMDDVALGAAAIGEKIGYAKEGRAYDQYKMDALPNAVARSGQPAPISQPASTGGELWQRPVSAAPWYQGALNDISGYSQGASSGSTVASALDQVLAKQPPTLDGSVTGARPYNPLDTGLTPSPYAVTDNLMERGPVHTLGVNGFRTGWSRPTVDYSGMMERSRADNHNMRIAEMLGRQEMARNAQGNENLRTMMALQQREDASRAMAESRYFGNLNRIPEGKRTPLINEGLSRGYVDQAVGSDMLLDEMLLRARMNAKTGSGVDLKRLLSSIGSEFDPNKLSRLDLISKLQRMGYTADQIAALESDPTVGQFAGSLLNPDPNPKEPPLKFLGLPLFGKASRQLWEW